MLLHSIPRKAGLLVVQIMHDIVLLLLVSGLAEVSGHTSTMVHACMILWH